MWDNATEPAVISQEDSATFITVSIDPAKQNK